MRPGLRKAALLSALALAAPAFPLVNSTAGLANPLDNSGFSARALALGSAFVGVADDSSALFWNPAGLEGLKRTELALHHNSWLAGIIQETAVLGIPAGKWGGLAASLNYVSYGTIPGYDEFGAETSSYSSNRYGLGLGWGKRVTGDFSAGLGLKGGMRSIAGDLSSDLALDLAGLWSVRPELRVGLAYSNLGTTLGGYSQASALRLGASYLPDFYEGHRIMLSVAGSFEPQGVNRLQAGVEDLIRNLLALRLGYQMSLADNQIQGLYGLTAGIGISHNSFSLDYAYIPFGDLGSAQRVSLGYRFGPQAWPHAAR